MRNIPLYFDWTRRIWGLYLPQDPDNTRVERNIPEGVFQYKPTYKEIIKALDEAFGKIRY